MTNTILLAGPHDPEEILKSVKRGVFAKKFGGGQVDISNGDFVFSLTESYLVEDGKITAPLKGVNLIGNGPDVLRKVTMLGNDVETSRRHLDLRQGRAERARRRRLPDDQDQRDHRRRHACLTCSRDSVPRAPCLEDRLSAIFGDCKEGLCPSLNLPNEKASMSDNSTAHKADEYEAEVHKTIPFHDEILKTAIDVVLAAKPDVKRWLDTGCGPGKLVELAKQRAPHVEYVLADPSQAMIDLARARHPGVTAWTCGSADLPEAALFDAITAVLCHHYLDAEGRMHSVERCRDRLVLGGVLVVFENVRPESDFGHAVQRKRWGDYQRSMGRDDEGVKKQQAREGTAFFPIRVSEHLALFARLGFTNVEIVWRAYGQAGFMAQRK